MSDDAPRPPSLTPIRDSIRSQVDEMLADTEARGTNQASIVVSNQGIEADVHVSTQTDRVRLGVGAKVRRTRKGEWSTAARGTIEW